MSRPCVVCALLERGEVDRKLSMQVCNLAALAREYGVPRKSMEAHRRNHLPLFLAAFQAQADALTLNELQAESRRLYLITLDRLAQAEAGTLQHKLVYNEETGESEMRWVQVTSHTSVARLIREARAGVDQLARLAADRGDEEGRPTSAEDLQLGDEIRKQLARVVARRAVAKQVDALDQVDGVDVVDRLGGVDADGGSTSNTGGGSTGSTPALAPPSFPVFSATPPEKVMDITDAVLIPDNDLPILTDEQLKTAAGAIGVTAETFMAQLQHKRQALEVHPEWHGNPAASKEERAAAGYEDVPVQDHRYDP